MWVSVHLCVCKCIYIQSGCWACTSTSLLLYSQQAIKSEASSKCEKTAQLSQYPTKPWLSEPREKRSVSVSTFFMCAFLHLKHLLPPSVSQPHNITLTHSNKHIQGSTKIPQGLSPSWHSHLHKGVNVIQCHCQSRLDQFHRIHVSQLATGQADHWLHQLTIYQYVDMQWVLAVSR